MQLLGRLCLMLLLGLVLGLSGRVSLAQEEPEKVRKLPPLPIDDDDEEVAPGELNEEEQPVDVEDTRREILDSLPELPIDDVRVGMDRSGVNPEAVCNPPYHSKVPSTMSRRIDRLLDTDKLKGARVGILAVAYPEGTVLYEKGAHESFNPASVSKIFTAVSALHALGSEVRFETRGWMPPGDCSTLYLQGDGDPGIDERDLRILAQKVKKAGVNCVRRVAWTESPLDDQILPPVYDQKRTDAAYRSRIGAIGLGRGAFTLRVKPGRRSGDSATIELFPESSAFLVDNKVVTVDPKRNESPRLRANVTDHKGHTVVHISGEISRKRKDGKTIRLALPNPSRFAAWYLQDRLLQEGIKVLKDTPRKSEVPEGATVVASVTSRVLSDDVKEMQEWSRNSMAEQLLKLLSVGRCEPYTFKCGIEHLLEVIQRYHVPKKCVQFKNGSGLYDANRVTPYWTVRFLIESANRGHLAEPFMDSFARGCKTGTLRNRMERVGRPVLAKTGTLDGISALAGYILRKKGGYIAFVIYFNDAPTSAWNMRKIQDRIVETLSLFDAQK